MPQLRFRDKVLFLAVALVVFIQVGTLIPVLNAIKTDQDEQAERSVRLAGVVFDEFIRNRTAQLTTTVDVLVADFPFRDAVASGDAPTIESVLSNHAARAGTQTAVVFDLDGNVLASTGIGDARQIEASLPNFVPDGSRVQAVHNVTFIDGTPYQTVTVPVRAPVTIAWVMLGFPIDENLANEISVLTGLEASFLRFGLGRVDLFATTLADEWRESAFVGVHLGNQGDDSSSVWGTDYITRLRPYSGEQGGLYAALQLPTLAVTASYTNIRNFVLIITAFALVLAIGGGVWISQKVTRPVQVLVDAAQRMREGIYNQGVNVHSKDEFADLAAGFNSMQEAIAQREQHIFHMAHHDSLSGLPTRDIIVGELRDTLAEADRLAVVNLVLHRFDGLASSLGHRTADQVIQLVAGQIRNKLNEDQLLGHLNSQEFVIVLPDCGQEDGEEFVRELKGLLRSGVTVGNANISLQVVAGLALYPDHGTEAGELLRCAAVARNDASHHIESVGRYQPGQEERALELIQIVGDFPSAMKNQELELEFQPKIDCETLAVSGAEALVRWHHPELGRLSPDSFVEAIEQAGAISLLTRWVLREAVKACADWRTHGIDVSMAINISADDLVDEYLPHFLLDIVSRHGLEPGRITLEVTESAIMHNPQMSYAVVSCIRELGFQVAIDDFGTGHSSLAQLKRLPVDELKIDKSFVLNMNDRRDEAVVRTAIELAHQFNLSAVAEGVEDEESLTRLRQLGCEYAQGFYFAKPLPAHEFLRWARHWADTRGSDLLSVVGASRA